MDWIGGSRISSDRGYRAGRTSERLLNRPRGPLGQEEQPGGEEYKGEHAEAKAEKLGIIKYPNMWLRAAEGTCRDACHRQLLAK